VAFSLAAPDHDFQATENPRSHPETLNFPAACPGHEHRFSIRAEGQDLAQSIGKVASLAIIAILAI
jgi:hypothetical protein